MATAPDMAVRGRCTCGKAFRVRRPRPHLAVRCPHCRAEIKLTDTGLRFAQIGTHRVALEPEHPAPPEGILVDYGDLRLAATDSHRGLTGSEYLANEDSMLADALSGRTRLRPLTGYREDDAEIVASLTSGAGPATFAEFVRMLVRGLLLAGNSRTAIAFLQVVLACIAPLSAGMLVAEQLSQGQAAVVLWFLRCYVAVLVAEFCWKVLVGTLRGEPGVGWLDESWEFGANIVRPLATLLLPVVAGFGPLMLTRWLLGDRAALLEPALLAAGAVLWLLTLGLFIQDVVRFQRPTATTLTAAAAVWAALWLGLMGATAAYDIWQESEPLAASQRIILVNLAVVAASGCLLFQYYAMALLWRLSWNRSQA